MPLREDEPLSRQETVDEEEKGEPVRRRRRRGWIILLVVVVVSAALGGALVLRLLSAPLTTAYGTGAIASSIEEGLGGGASAAVGVVGFALSADFQPELHLRDVRVDRPGRATGSIDTLSVTTSWLTLIGRETVVDRVVADHVVVETTASDERMPAVPEVIAAVDAALTDTALGLIDIDAFTLIRRVDGAGRRTLLDKAAVTAERSGTRVEARIAAAGVTGPWSVRASIERAVDGDGGGRVVDLAVNGLDLRDLSDLADVGDAVASGPMDFSGRLGLGEDGALSAGEGQLTIGPIEATDADGGVMLDRSRLAVRWRPEDRTVVVEPSPVVLPGGHAIVTGEVRMPERTGGAVPFALRVSGRAESAPDAAGEVVGRYDPSRSLLVVDRMTVRGAGAEFTAAMRAGHADGQVTGALSGVFPEMSVAALKAIWPPMVSPEARRWVSEHVSAGVVREASVDLAVLGGDLEAEATAGLTFRFEDLVFTPIDDGPPIRSAFGTGRLDGDRFEIDLERGVVDLEDGRTLAIERGRFVIPTIVPDPPDGEIELTLSGDADAAVRLWERLPLSRGVELPADSNGVTGSASADVTVRLPLVKDVLASQVSYQGRIRFADLAFKKPVEGRTIRGGQIAIDLTDGVAAITGTAEVDGVKAEVNITRPLEGGGGSSAVRLVLGAADRTRLGLDAGERLAGPVAVTLTDLPAAEGESVQSVVADLSSATVRLPEIGFSKAKGRPAEARFTLRKANGRTRMEDFVLEAGGVRVEGALLLDANGLVSADLPKVRLNASDRLSAKVRRADGALTIALTGDRFDARNLLAAALKPSAGGGGPSMPVVLDVAVGTVTGWGEEALTGLNLAARLEAGRLQALSFTAQTAGGGAASATVTPSGKVRRIEAEAGEVGRLLRFIDLYPRVFGGRARITGTIDGRGHIVAAVDGSRWKIVEEPALARLSTAAKDGPTAGLTTADIQRLVFDLRFGDGRLTIDDGVIRADTAGLSIQGDVDFTRKSLRLAGTYLPASALDSLIGKIPLLGQTVFAGGRAGLFGVTFRLSGPIDDPTLSVNPLSVIAPGIFRKLFELQ